MHIAWVLLMSFQNLFVYMYMDIFANIYLCVNMLCQPEIIPRVNPTELDPTKYFVHCY